MPLNLERLSTLVVEDTEPMRDLITAVLERFGIGRVLHASNGNEAFGVFCEHAPDIIITDWHMNSGTGIDLVTKIRRAEESPNRVAPVIMLTGFNAASRVKKSRDSGITEYLTKPFKAEDLLKRILYVINAPRDFILNPSYFGPDRRRKKSDTYDGPLRRMSDYPDFNSNPL